MDILDLYGGEITIFSRYDLAAVNADGKQFKGGLLTSQFVCKRPIATPADAVSLLSDCYPIENKLEEELVVLTLNNLNEVSGIWVIAKGNDNCCVASPSAIFKRVLLSCCEKAILVHNHPAGSIKPSRDDVDFTRKCLEGSRLLGIQLLDHIIVSSGGYYSFRHNSGMKTEKEKEKEGLSGIYF